MDPYKHKVDTCYAQLTGPGAPFELVTETINGQPLRVFRNAPRTLRELYAPTYAHGDKEFVLYEGERWSFARVLGTANAIAHRLVHRNGVRKGDRVAIAMRNCPQWMAAYIGITSAGAVVVPLNSWGRGPELEFALVDAGAKVVFCDRQRHDYVAERAEALGLTLIVALAGAQPLPAGSLHFEDYIEGAANMPLPDVDISPDDLAVIAYTSGTTGNPKGAASTHRAVCQTITCFECSAAAQGMANQEVIGAMMARGFEPSSLLAVPLFHVSGCYAVFMTSLRAGRRIVIMYKWDVDQALQLIEQERLTTFTAAPSMLMDLLESPNFERHDMSSLFAVGAGGAATPAKIGLLMARRIKDAMPGTGWGLTETNGLGSSFGGAAFHEHVSSAGYVQPIIDLSFRDEEGAELPPGEPGIIWMRSVCLANGYWNRPDATAKEFRDGWFNSGDIGYLSADGYLYLTDRAKDMLIRGGENIYPLEIEKTLMDAPEVLETVGFGVPDEQMGEELALVVRLKEPGSLDAAQVRSFLAARLAGFKVPRYIEITDEPLPRNATHKVLKKDVRQAFLAAHGKP